MPFYIGGTAYERDIVEIDYLSGMGHQLFINNDREDNRILIELELRRTLSCNSNFGYYDC